jgi:hypothetical protein
MPAPGKGASTKAPFMKYPIAKTSRQPQTEVLGLTPAPGKGGLDEEGFSAYTISNHFIQTE